MPRTVQTAEFPAVVAAVGIVLGAAVPWYVVATVKAYIRPLFIVGIKEYGRCGSRQDR
jgi:hypothetical protein